MYITVWYSSGTVDYMKLHCYVESTWCLFVLVTSTQHLSITSSFLHPHDIHALTWLFMLSGYSCARLLLI